MRSSSRPIFLGCLGLFCGLSLWFTRPARTQAAATVREATPSFDKARATPTRRTEAGRVSVRVLRGCDMVRTVMPYRRGAKKRKKKREKKKKKKKKKEKKKKKTPQTFAPLNFSKKFFAFFGCFSFFFLSRFNWALC